MVRNGDTIPDFGNKGNDEFNRTYDDSSDDFGQNLGQETQDFSRDYNNVGNMGNSNTIIIDISKSAEISNAWMIITKGRNTGREYSVPPQGKPEQRRIALGRSSINDIVLDDPAVSDEHAFIIYENNTYSLGDAGSLNGTLVNGKKISNFRKLNDGDNLTLGETEVEFKCISVSIKSPEKNKSKTKKTSRSRKSTGKTIKEADPKKPQNSKIKNTNKLKKIIPVKSKESEKAITS